MTKNTILAIIISFIGLLSFVSIYLSFESIHETKVVIEQIDSLKIEQEKITYLIDNQKDTIIINNNILINKKQ